VPDVVKAERGSAKWWKEQEEEMWKNDVPDPEPDHDLAWADSNDDW
jgi:hypothetical protein